MRPDEDRVARRFTSPDGMEWGGGADNDVPDRGAFMKPVRRKWESSDASARWLLPFGERSGRNREANARAA
jgi:hypothetical protein